MGSFFSCAIKDDNSLWIWGNSNYSFIYGSQPTKILDDVISVKAGERWGSAITVDGTLWVWGDDVFNKSSKPRKALENVICTAQNAAIASDYTLWTWGDNYHGQLGNGTFEDSNTPQCVMHDVKYISSRGSTMAAIKTDGTLWMWGSNSRGELGNGETDNSSVPIKVMDHVRYVDVGSDMVVAITEKSELYAWGGVAGYNNSGNKIHGYVGNGTDSGSLVPVKIMDNVKTASAGFCFGAVINQNDELWMWGKNSRGELGNGTIELSTVPIKIMDNVDSVSCGNFHTAAVTKDGTLWTWGENCSGELGDESIDDYSDIPVKIMENLR